MELHDDNIMTGKDRKRVRELYNSDEPVTAYVINPGFRTGHTTKARLDAGRVDGL